jgi:N-acetylmuramate 1-kinase
MTDLAAAAASAPIVWPDASRQADFNGWLHAIAARHAIDPTTLVPASADASFRRYFRVQAAAGPLIVMDAPPPLEDVRPFVQVAGLIEHAGLHGPRVLEADPAHGFLLLTDLGSRLYINALQDAGGAQAEPLMRDAIRALVAWQSRVPCDALPPYDEALLKRELALFPEWCVQREFGVTWTAAEQAAWQGICRLLIDSALAQPTVAVHRDWMPRNLMVADPNPGILDFQDAVRGPITYDVASLLRDAFISWDEERELDWAVRWWEQARRAGLPLGEAFSQDFGECWRGIEWMGLQRHLKVLGIFCRLKHRDGKARYAEDLPRFFAYAQRVAMRYTPLAPLVRLIAPLQGTVVSTGLTF